MNKFNSRKPFYNDDSDYTTNAPSYYDDLARKNKLIKLLSQRIWEYEKTLNMTLDQINKRLTEYINENDSLLSKRLKEWDQKLIDFDDDVKKLLQVWVDDGTMDHIINETIFSWKADKEYVDKEFTKIHNDVSKRVLVSDYERQLSLLSFPKYGRIDFDQFEGLQHNINFSVWRDIDGRVKHNHKLDEEGYVNKYVSVDGVNTPNNGDSPEEAWLSLKYAISQIESDTTLSKVKINLRGLMSRDYINIDRNTTITKDYIITSDTPIGTHQPVNDWSIYQGTVYKGSLPYNVTGVIGLNEKVELGKYIQLKKVDTLSECEKTYNSFFSNGTNIYVNRKDVTSTNTVCLIETIIFQIELSGGVNQKFSLKDMTLLNGGKAQPCYITTDTGVKGKVELHNVTLQNTGYNVSLNGFMFDGVKDVKLFDCKGFDIVRDIFNYHNTKNVNEVCTVFEYNCFGYNAGKMKENTNDNISSAHDGIHIIRVNTNGSKSSGPLIADVNGCYSLNIDVFVHDTGLKSLSSRVNSAFYFNDTATSSIPNPNGKAWLINCGGGSPTEWGISCDDSFKQKGKIFIDNFNGYNIPADIDFTVFEQKVVK